MAELALSLVQAAVQLVVKIYEDVQEVKHFKSRSKTLSQRIQVLTRPLEVLGRELQEGRVKNVQDQEITESTGADVTLYIRPLRDLTDCLKQAQEFIEKLKTYNLFDKWLEKNDISENFDRFNERITTLKQSLTFCLQVALKGLFTEEMQKNIQETFNRFAVLEQNQKDLKEDMEEMKKTGKPNEDTNKMVHKISQQLIEIGRQLDLRKDSADTDYLKIRYEDLHNIKELTKGTYGPIFTATHRHEQKVLKRYDDNSQYAAKELRDELEKWRHLQYSKFIVQLSGYAIDDDGLWHFVLEYMPYGTLRNVLRDSEHSLPWDRRIKMALDCAQGLEAIHYGQVKKMLHRAVTSARFLVNEDYGVKISDNGFVKPESKISKSTVSHGDADEMDYLCPEKTQNTQFKPTIKSEIYRLGIVLYEIASRKRPFETLQKGDEPVLPLTKFDYISNGSAEEPPTNTPAGLKDLIAKCRSRKPTDRPTTGKVVESLMTLSCQRELLNS